MDTAIEKHFFIFDLIPRRGIKQLGIPRIIGTGKGSHDARYDQQRAFGGYRVGNCKIAGGHRCIGSERLQRRGDRFGGHRVVGPGGEVGLKIIERNAIAPHGQTT